MKGSYKIKRLRKDVIEFFPKRIFDSAVLITKAEDIPDEMKYGLLWKEDIGRKKEEVYQKVVDNLGIDQFYLHVWRHAAVPIVKKRIEQHIRKENNQLERKKIKWRQLEQKRDERRRNLEDN